MSKTLQSAVDRDKRSRGSREAGDIRGETGVTGTASAGAGAFGDGRGGGGGGEGGDGRGQEEFSVELEGLRTAMVLLAHVPS